MSAVAESPVERPAAIEIADLTVAYDRRPAVHHLSGRFAAGSLTAIVGPNGAGKSTLLKTIVGILKPDQGQLSLGGLDRRDIAYLPQQAEIDRSFPITVADTVALGLWRDVGIFGAVGADQRRRVHEALAIVGIDRLGGRPIGSLSAGQLQRVMFARLMLQEARIILLDEPFAAVDSRTTADLLDLVHRWHREGRTVLAVLHDLEQVRGHFPESLLLAREPVAWGPTLEVLTPDNLTRARRLSEGWVEADTAPHGKVLAFPRHER
jgi:zinc/manganese transport system ATP-binding protein